MLITNSKGTQMTPIANNPEHVIFIDNIQLMNVEFQGQLPGILL